MKRILLSEAADRLGISYQACRVAVLEGRLPIGRVIRRKSKSTYLIYDELVNDYMQKGGTEAWGR